MLKININTYVTIEEADDYISSHYLSTSEEVENWENLSDEDKEILLINATDNIQCLILTGRKKDINQTLVFPRFNCTENDMTLIKNAQVEEAISLIIDNSTYIAYNEGLKSESIDSISKVYNIDLLKSKKMNSSKAQNMLKRWLYGHFKVC